MTVRRAIIAALLLAGAGFVVVGVRNWLDVRNVRTTVEDFLAAVCQGNAEHAVAMLSADRRKDLSRNQAATQQISTRIEGVEIQILEVTTDGDTAVARVQLEKDGFTLKPIVQLIRDDSGEWKVDQIDDLFQDSRWQQFVQKRRRKLDRQTTADLKNALHGAPGVTVQRIENRADDSQ